MTLSCPARTVSGPKRAANVAELRTRAGVLEGDPQFLEVNMEVLDFLEVRQVDLEVNLEVDLEVLEST